MENKTTYLRNNKGFYQQIPIRLINDDKLSPYAKFIMIVCISNNDKWVINRKEIQKRVGFEEYKFRKGWDELKKYRYIEIIRKKRCCHYIINEAPNIDTPTIDTDVNISADSGALGPNLDTGINDTGVNLIYTNLNIDQTRVPKTKVLKGGGGNTGGAFFDGAPDSPPPVKEKKTLKPEPLSFDSSISEKELISLDFDVSVIREDDDSLFT